MKNVLLNILAGLAMVSLLGGCKKELKLPSLQETFLRQDKIPFGTSVMYNQVKELYNRNNIVHQKTDLNQFENKVAINSCLYISVTNHFYTNESEKNALLRFVEAGNTAFICTGEIMETLADEIGAKPQASRSFSATGGEEPEITSVSVEPPYFPSPATYEYYYLPFTHFFSLKEPANWQVLGRNMENGRPNFMVYHYGKGKLFLHCEPRALSNLFLLRNNNIQYLQQLFAFTNDAPYEIYWDDYYPSKRNVNHEPKNSSGLATLLKFPGMAGAFWLALLLLVLYLVFGSKRRQRIVPIIPPVTNSTIAFTETIGRLYYQTKDNKNIADKMVLHLQDYIRNKFYMNSNVVNEQFLQILSRKSNYPYNDTLSLFKLVGQIQQSTDVSDQTVLDLNYQIEQFYKNNP